MISKIKSYSRPDLTWASDNKESFVGYQKNFSWVICIRLPQVSSSTAMVAPVTREFCWLHGKLHAKPFQSFILFPDIIHKERCRANPLAEKSFLVCLCRRILVWLKNQLSTILVFRRNNSQPPVIPGGDICLFYKAKDLGVKSKCLRLVVHKNTGES